MREKEEYIYSSTELSRYYGISVKGMEFYEQKNLVHPERIGPGKTRRYNLPDCYQFATARMLRNCGFCIEDTAALLADSRPEYVRNRFTARADQLEEEIRLQEGVVRGIRRKTEGIESIQKGDIGPRVQRHPGFFRLFIRRFAGRHTSTEEESGQLSHWNRLMPITEASLRIPKEDLLGAGEIMDTEVGMIITQEDFFRYHLDRTDRVSFIPPGRAVYGIASGPETELDRKEALEPLLALIRQREYVVSGDGFSRLIHVMDDERAQRKRYDEVWIPIE